MKNTAPRFYRRLLLVYPKRFRRKYGNEAIRQLQSDLREARNAGPIRAALGQVVGVADFILAGFSERIASRKAAAKAKRPPRSGMMMISSAAQDLRFAARSFLRQPGFTAVAVLTLALGLGTMTAVFSVVNGVLLRPLPYPDAARLVRVWSEYEEQGWTRSAVSRPDIADIRLLDGVDFVEGFVPNTFTLPADGRSVLVEGSYVSGGLLEGFGLAPAVGRDIRQEENRRSAAPVVVVGHSFWQRRFAGDPDILGTMMQIDEESYEVVGIAPPGFDFPQGSQLWVPHRHPCYGSRGCRNLGAVGRLAPGTELSQAQAALTVLGTSFREQYPGTNGQVSFRYEPLIDVMVGEVRAGLWVLLGAVTLMLLVVCANLANLLLARASARRGEVAVRTALGASRGRLMRQFLVESLVIAGLGCGAGLAAASGLVSGFKTAMAGSFPRVAEVGMDANVILFAVALMGLVAIVFGSSPALHMVGQSVVGGLRGRDGGHAGRREGAARSWLLGAEVALSVVLMVGAGLLMRSLGEMYEVDQGFEHREVLRFTLTLPPGEYGDPESLVSLFQEVEATVDALPGVAAVGSVVGPPLGRQGPSSGNVDVEGRPAPEPSDVTFASVHAATPGYFATLGFQVIRGRGLEREDHVGGTPVAVVSERFARENFSEREVLGQRFQVAVATGFGKTWTAVGVVRDTRSSLTGDLRAQVYVPLVQAISDLRVQQQDLTRALRTLTVHVRGSASGIDLLSVIQRQLEAVDARIMTAGVETVAAAIHRAAGPTRHQLQLMSLFAALAVVLAAVGLYGVVSYLVSQRTREIGIRLALGARGGEITGMVVRQGIIPAGAGIAAGLAVSLGVGRVLGSLLYEVQHADPLVFGAVALLTLALSAGAILIPARQAVKLDPTVALRLE